MANNKYVTRETITGVVITEGPISQGPVSPTVGCKDPMALNYDPTFTYPCVGCCQFEPERPVTEPTEPIGPSLPTIPEGPRPAQIVGCKDPNAINYRENADISCNNCCEYKTEPERPTEPKEPIRLIVGCRNRGAINYEEKANVDCNNCCEYKTEPERPTESIVTCPKITDGDVNIISTDVETINGVVFMTYAEGVTETCCSNKSLNSNMPGDWIWDGSRCVLNVEVDNTKYVESTTITISETPVTTDECEDVTLTTYVYFNEPGNMCNGGERLTTPYTPEVSETFYSNLPVTSNEVSTFSNNTWNDELQPQEYNTPTPQTTENCCYDVTTPINGRLVIQDVETGEIIDNGVTYLDTYTSTEPSLIDFDSPNGGFNKWIKLTTTVNVGDLEQFNLGVEFTSGLFKCCDYDIYFDDISVNCDKVLIKETYNTEKCPGFELRRVIDNKKSWVYNPGTENTSDSVYDNIVRSYGDVGLIQGHGDINRTFAPSVDAELNYRDTDYYGFHNVMEKHSKLVLNSKEVVLQFNMCSDYDCSINPQYLIDDDGGYILDDDGGRIIIGSSAPMPNLLQLEQFKKTFQGFWVQFMEQFIPATTIFIAGEKWCNPIVCEEKVVCDYMMDVSSTDGILSPSPITLNVTETENVVDSNTNTTPTPITLQSGDAGGTNSTGVSVTTYDAPIGQPITVGNTSLYTLDILDPDLGTQVVTRNLFG